MDISFLSKEEINELVIEYLIIEGYKDAADKFILEIGSNEKSLENHVHSNSLSDRMEIRQFMMARNIEKTIDIINQKWPDLFDKSPYIYYQLRQLQMLELIREKNIEEALSFAQKHLSDLVQKFAETNPHLICEMENTMALLAFENPQDSAYGSLLSDNHLEMVSGSLNREILKYMQDQNIDEPNVSKAAFENYGITTTIPRLTKMMSFLLYLQDQSQIEIPKELTNLD